MAEVTDSIDISNLEILTDRGFKPILKLHKTVPYRVFVLKTETHQLECADLHIVYNEDYNEVYVKDLKVGDSIITESGPEKIVSIDILPQKEEMYDVSVDDSLHRFYADGILSHNSTLYTIFALHYAIFNKDKTVLFVANKESTVKELLQRVKLAYTLLPNFLKLGVITWSAKTIQFDNGCKIMVSATSPDSARGSSCDVCLSDETWIIVQPAGSTVLQYIPLRSLVNSTQCIDNRKFKFTFRELLKQELENNKDISDLEFLCNLQRLISNPTARQQLKYHLSQGCLTIPRCPICGKKLYNRFRNGKYYATCSVKCSKQLSKQFNIKRTYKITEQTVLTPEGVKHFEGISLTDASSIREITFEGDIKLTVSDNHKFQLANGTIKEAHNLKFNDSVKTVQGTVRIIKNIPKMGYFHLYDLINVKSKDNLYYTNGIVSHNCILDEAAFIENNVMDEFTASVFPTISSRPQGKIIAVSTPNGMGNWFAETYFKALYKVNDVEGNISGDLNWKAVTFPWYEHPDRDEAWAKRQLTMLGSQRKFNQEFACEFLGSSSTLFEPKVIEHYKHNILNKIDFKTENIDAVELNVYEPPLQNHAYSMGVDISDGTGGDSSTIELFDITDLRNIRQVVSFNNANVSATKLAYICARIGARYNTALISGERNGVGTSFFDTLVNTFEYDNILNYKSETEVPENAGIISNNTNKVKACLYAKDLLSACLIQPQKIKIDIKDSYIVYEMEFFESRNTGKLIRYSATKNHHDDAIMAFIWALFPLNLNLADNYFNVRGTVYLNNGIEVPSIILPLPSNYTEAQVIKMTGTSPESLKSQQERESDLNQRKEIADGIMDAVLGNSDLDDYLFK